MDILSTGFIPADPLQLLSSHHLLNALMVLRRSYDRVIIDTPPLLSVSDALVLSKQADAVLFVVKPGAASILQINHALDLLIRVNARVIGIVLNKLDMQKAGKYGSYAAQPLAPTSGIAARIRGRFDSRLAPTMRQNFLSFVETIGNATAPLRHFVGNLVYTLNRRDKPRSTATFREWRR